ncbi:MAG TPA: ATP-dependent DNA ligase [Longimicrobiaceae bacterium]|nr:ATP-dependent DNA ligase [Longimicrobiaceae bacterium]
MSLPIPIAYPPAESEQADELPTGPDWQYEPKWDGFRCLAFRDGDEVDLRSKAGKPLARYFPDVADALLSLRASRFVLDAEIVVPVGDTLSFEELQLRLHPAASRVQKLAAAHPALVVAFDLLLGPRGGPLIDRPLRERREKLEAFAGQFFGAGERVRLSPMTCDEAQARAWLQRGERGLDGVMAKRLDEPYRSGERAGMVKVKNVRTVDCVVGGFRYAPKERIVGSLLLGLYGEDGKLHHVGFCSGIGREERRELTPRLEALRKPPGFTGSAPGGPSRWSAMNPRSTEWEPLAPELVVEVGYDAFTGGRFRHGTRFYRWRPDKAPEQCTFAQLGPAGRSSLRLLEG